MDSKAVKTNNGVATNGLDWILLRYDESTHKTIEIASFTLRPLLAKMLGQETFSDDDLLKTFCLVFSKENILITLGQSAFELERKKDEISRRFYADYMALVFGKMAKSRSSYCLIKAIRTQKDVSEKDLALFSITLMNRLFFIKFLEDKKLVKPGLLHILWNDFKSKKSIPVSFYKGYLEPLFFGVFNIPRNQRSAHVLGVSYFRDLPYLNGGLFRAVEGEREYEVEDPILELIINNLLEKYDFSISDKTEKLDPAVLGNVFEKTVNYIASPGTDAQKQRGAYYTPDDVTSYITKNTLHPFLLEKIVEDLKGVGWKESDLRDYINLESFLNNLPRNKKDVYMALEVMNNVKILDPACGSGHFLTAALNELLHIKERILKALDAPIDVYELKRKIVSQNLYGVDIEELAVEIAKLRLWLSLIENMKVSDAKHMGTLPNIEFNIMSGDSLNGWLSETISVRFLKPIDIEVEPFLLKLEKVYADSQEKLDVIKNAKNMFLTFDVIDILNAYSSLRQIYPLETRKGASAISDVLNNIRHVMNDLVIDSLAATFLPDKDSPKLKKYKKEQMLTVLMHAFNWKVEFFDVIQQGGFDVIIGNPPYVESTIYGVKIFGNYDTSKCGNTYAYFLERSIHLLKDKGRIGVIVSLSAFCTQRMEFLITLLEKNCSEIRVSHYGWRPSKLFTGVNRALSIMLGSKMLDKKACVIYTTTYTKWYSKPINERLDLFSNIKYHRLSKKYEPFIVPKIGTMMEEKILKKIYRYKDKTIGKFMSKKEAKNVIYYRTTGGLYWKIITDFQPKFFENGIKRKSSRENCIYFETEEHQQLALAIYNSNLFWWFYTINSNGRDLNPFDLESLPIDLDVIPAKISLELRNLVAKLMEELIENSEYKIRIHRNKKPVKYQEISPRKSKYIIDKIDKLLAKVYDFSEKEVDFLTHYDERFRMGAKEEDSE